MSLPPLENKTRWYYDACALESTREVIREIANLREKYNTIALTSPLAIGEAYGACLRKARDKETPEILEGFLELIKMLYDQNLLYVVGHDAAMEPYKKLLEMKKEIDNQRLQVGDILHVATAIAFHCQHLITTDQDLLGFLPKKFSEVANHFGCTSFSCRSPLQKVKSA